MIITDTSKVSKMLKRDITVQLIITKSFIDHCILPSDNPTIGIDQQEHQLLLKSMITDWNATMAIPDI